MSILAGEVQSTRRAARRSVREVCLLGMISRPSGPEWGWGTGARVTLSGRVYRVEATGASSSGREDEDKGVCYVHLGAVVERAE